MPLLHFVTPADAGESRVTDVQARSGQSLMQAAVDAGLGGIAADCGGLLTCATCHVYVQEPWASALPPASADEQAMLEFVAAPRLNGSRLSCQIVLTDGLDGLTVQLPDVQY